MCALETRPLNRSMATWATQKANFQQQKQQLDTATSDAQLDSKVTAMNQALARFSAKAGISTNPNEDPDYNTAQQIFTSLADFQKQYSTLNQHISATLRDLTAGADIQQKLRTVGELKQSIGKLEQELINAKQDAETSRARQETVDKPAEHVTWYQGFSAKIGFTRPLRLTSIPFLIGFGILFLFLTGLILKDFFAPSAGNYTNVVDSGSVFAVFSDARFYSVLAGVAFVSVLLGVLAATGKLGKRI